MTTETHKDIAKYRQIYTSVHEDITNGRYHFGQQLPTDMELAEQFSASRPTVAKALGALQKQGLVERRIGSGTYVRYGRKDRQLLNLALLIPGLGETEIFESICGHMAHLAEEKQFNLVWSGSMADDAEARRRHIEQLAARYVQQKVDGVFFAPLELTSEKDTVNEHIVSLFENASIPVILMDRDIAAFPNRSPYDLVGVDNFRIGYLMTQHLISQGCRHITFVARPFSAPTVDMRICGYKEAVNRMTSTTDFDNAIDVHIGNVDDTAGIEALLKRTRRLGIVCANDTHRRPPHANPQPPRLFHPRRRRRRRYRRC